MWISVQFYSHISNWVWKDDFLCLVLVNFLINPPYPWLGDIFNADNRFYLFNINVFILAECMGTQTLHLKRAILLVTDKRMEPGDLLQTLVPMHVFPETEPEELAGPLQAASIPSQLTEEWSLFIYSVRFFHGARLVLFNVSGTILSFFSEL